MNIYWKQSLIGVPRTQPKSESIKIFTSWVHWKNLYRSTIRKHALLWNKHEYQHSADVLLKICLSHFMALVFFYISWNTSENQKFLDVFKGHRKTLVPGNVLSRVSHKCVEHGGGPSMFYGGCLSQYIGGKWGGGGLETVLSRYNAWKIPVKEGVDLLVKFQVISLQACNFTKNELLYTYFSRIFALF